ncbi:MAG: chromosome partitioning protein [Actinobacteria bacterium]|nr:chromosome partitioning protein [Actinomycetota bacterium]MCA1721909.1 chromosome partitioning protein [Actinomycetota bacterium]
MSVPVLTAVSDAVWESHLVAALERGDLGVSVVRRCVDLADLLATAATGQARAVLLSADLRRLDRDALSRLAVAGVAVVGLVPPADEEAERRLRQLGVVHVLPSDASPEDISAAVMETVQGHNELAAPSQRSYGDPRAALPDLPAAPPPVHVPEVGLGTGRIVAVWGPTGAPGRTTLAVGIASELAALGRSTLLIDGDVYGGVVAQVLGVLDEAPGLAAAARQANNGQLDLPALAALARAVTPTLRLLSGIARADRWPELRPSAVEVVLGLARSLSSVTVVDCGFSLEQDEELAYDTAAPRRNGATLAFLEAADTVVAVGSADPVGLQRLIRGLGELKEAVPGLAPRVVVNRVRASGVPGDPEKEIAAALSRYAGVDDLAFVPLDVAGVDGAVASGRTLVEAAASSPARLALAELAAGLVGAPRAVRKRRLLGRGGKRAAG